MRWSVLLVLAACTHDSGGPLLPEHAGLPADVTALAAAPATLGPLPEAVRVEGATVVHLEGQPPVTRVAVALPDGTAPATQALWVRQVLRVAQPKLVDIATVRAEDHTDAVHFVLDAGDTALEPLLSAIRAPALDDDALATAVSTRPDLPGAADPDSLRALATTAATRETVWIASTEPDIEAMVARATADWPHGDGVESAQTAATVAGRYLSAVTAPQRVGGPLAADGARDAARGHLAAASRHHADAAVLLAQCWRANASATEVWSAVDTAAVPQP